ncbi:hypothetical protein SUDANB171_00688 [Streptomyces sp. enrichment culture]|uniref:hypothetical protein n=1 Tax=Streptomyces sp. enrichment culture TaxID=1795815 RepID=UPI003F578350
MDVNRNRPLEDLVRWNGELSGLIRDARQDERRTTVTFRRGHAVAAVEKVTTGDASPGKLVDWAQAVHFEDRLHVEEGHEDLLTQFLFEISTPELLEPVTHEVCQRWLSILRTSLDSYAEVAERQDDKVDPTPSRPPGTPADHPPHPSPVVTVEAGTPGSGHRQSL